MLATILVDSTRLTTSSNSTLEGQLLFSSSWLARSASHTAESGCNDPSMYQPVGCGFTVYCCGDRRAPNVLVAAYDWGDYMDVINIRGVDRVAAAGYPYTTA
jgi:hypothetical protein